MEKHLVAACQINCGPDSKPAENVEKIESHLQETAAKGARLALFPEVCLTGYSWDKDDILARIDATAAQGNVERVRKCATKLGLATAFGLYQRAGDGSDEVYNVTVVIAPDGSEMRYRKVHIPPNESAVTPGDQPPVVADLGFVHLGVATCFDNWFPESARMAYLAGAEILHAPFYWPAEWEVRDEIDSKRTEIDKAAILCARRERMMKVFPARALDNGMYVVMLDQVGESDDVKNLVPGKSMVFDPYGEVVAETKGWAEETLYFEFLPDRLQSWRQNPFFPGSNLRLGVYKRYLPD